MTPPHHLQSLYQKRFDPKLLQNKVRLWQIFIQDFLSRYISPQDRVLDIGGGYCEFINQIEAKQKVLVDLNPDARRYANPDVVIFNESILELSSDRLGSTFTRIFISNFFEHLNSHEEVIKVLSLCFKILLEEEGKILIIQPNFKYSYREYYDFFDHKLPLTHLSLTEALSSIGFQIEQCIPRFMPFSTKSYLSSPKLLKLYLKLPILWRFFGKQMFVVASKQKP